MEFRYGSAIKFGFELDHGADGVLEFALLDVVVEVEAIRWRDWLVEVRCAHHTM